MYDYRALIAIAEVEFSDLVDHVDDLGRKIRLYLKDGSYVDVWYSVRSKIQRYAYHWERVQYGTIYRHDNIPDGEWMSVPTFPKHCHDGSYENVAESHLSDDPRWAMREFLRLVRDKLQ